MRHHHPHFDCSTYAGQTASDDPVQSMDNYQRPCRIDGSSMTRNPSKVVDESPAKRQIESTFDGPSGPENLDRPPNYLRSKATSRRCPKLTGLMTMRPALSRRPKIVGRRDSDSTPDTMPRGSWNRFQHFVSLSIHPSISFSNQPTARLRGPPSLNGCGNSPTRLRLKRVLLLRPVLSRTSGSRKMRLRITHILSRTDENSPAAIDSACFGCVVCFCDRPSDL